MNKDVLAGGITQESIFIKDQRYRQKSHGHRDVVFDLILETRFFFALRGLFIESI